MAISSLGSYTLTAPGLGSGTVEFNPLDANGNKTGWLDMGYVEEFTLTIDPGTPLEVFSRRNAARAKIFSKAGTISRTINFVSDSIATEILKLWLAATDASVSQSAVAVTDEEIENIAEGRIYRLGESSSNPSGVKGAASVSIRNYDSTKAAWSSTTAYAVGDNVEKVSDDGTVFRCKTAGTSGGSEPTWVEAAIGDETTDGTVTWEYIAAANTTYTADTHYEIDTDADQGARFLWISATVPLYAYADYTPTANARTRLTTGDTIEKSGWLRFNAEEPAETEWVFPSVTLRPSGDYALIGDETSLQQVTFDAEILEPTTGAAIYRDGAAA